MSIMKVERYERTTRGPIVQQVEDLKPAMYYEQRFQGGRTRSDKKIYKITPCTSAHSHRKLPRLVFRKGTYRAERLDEKVVLELSGFEDCLYILYFEKALHAGVFLGYIKGTSDDITLDIASDVRSYLERGLPLVASTSPSAEDDTRTLQLAKWSWDRSRRHWGHEIYALGRMKNSIQVRTANRNSLYFHYDTTSIVQYSWNLFEN